VIAEQQPGSDLRGRPWLMTQDQLDNVIEADHRRSWRSALMFGAAFLAAATAIVALGTLFTRQAPRSTLASALVLAAFCLIAAVVVPAAVVMLHRMRRRQWQRRQRECEELASVVEEIEDQALAKLVSFNFRLMDRFTSTALAQARASYLACSVAGAAALLVLLAGTAAVVTVSSIGAQVTTGALTAAGATLSGFLSVTFLRTFEMTSRQMSYYYGQPLVHCYLLHAEWLAERFGEDAEPTFVASIRMELIRAALDAGRHAQDHLLDLQRTTSTNHSQSSVADLAMHKGHQSRSGAGAP
jgi:MFS family permease